MIHVSNATRRRMARATVQSAAQAALEAEGCGHLDVSVAIVSDEAIRAVHRDYLGDDTPTDVISFTLREEDDPDALLGELVVSIDTAHSEAKARGIPLAEEVCRYVIHGTLHLLGYEDDTPAKRKKMHARQEEILRGVTEAATPPRSARPRAARPAAPPGRRGARPPRRRAAARGSRPARRS